MDCLYVLFVEVKDFYQTFLPKLKINYSSAVASNAGEPDPYHTLQN